MDNREVRFTSTIDWIIASITTVIIFGIFIVLRYVIGLDLVPADISDGDRVIIYVASVAFVFLYTMLIENILRWCRLVITKVGKRLYNRKHIDGFPVNEEFMGYKLIESKLVIKEVSEFVNKANDMELFESTVWFANMEFRQRAYNKLLRRIRKKLNKQLRRAKKKRLESEFDAIQAKLDENKNHIQVTIDLLSAINAYNKEKVIELDTYLYERYDVTAREFDAQVLLDDEFNGMDTVFDRIRNSKAYDIIFTWILPIIVGVSFVLVGFLYEWNFEEVLTESDKILLTMLGFYLVTKIPTTTIKAFDRFPRQYVKPAQDAAYIFKKYMFRRRKTKDKPIENKE